MPIPKIHKENKEYLHFLTLTTVEWIDIFTKPQYFNILANSLKYCIEHKGLLANSFKRNKLSKNQVWQSGNYPEVIESEKFLDQKIEYIHNNAVLKEYVTKPEDWYWSSAGHRLQVSGSPIPLIEY